MHHLHIVSWNQLGLEISQETAKPSHGKNMERRSGLEKRFVKHIRRNDVRGKVDRQRTVVASWFYIAWKMERGQPS